MASDSPSYNGWCLFFLTLARIGASIVCGIKFSPFFFFAIPCALSTPCGFGAAEEQSKENLGYYISSFVLFTIFWLMGIHVYASEMPWFVPAGAANWLYLGLWVNMVIDLYIMRKPIQHWAGKFMSKDIKEQYKSLKKEKSAIKPDFTFNKAKKQQKEQQLQELVYIYKQV